LIRACLQAYLDQERLFFIIDAVNEITREKLLNGEKNFQDILRTLEIPITYIN